MKTFSLKKSNDNTRQITAYIFKSLTINPNYFRVKYQLHVFKYLIYYHPIIIGFHTSTINFLTEIFCNASHLDNQIILIHSNIILITAVSSTYIS